MVNTNKLSEKIKESGLLRTYIARKLGVTRPTLRAKIEGESFFTDNEMVLLGELLQLNNEEFMEIFFPSLVKKFLTEEARA